MSLSENMHKGEESDIRKVKNMKVPKIDLVICNSRASNTGELTGAAATEIVREYNDVGILFCLRSQTVLQDRWRWQKKFPISS